MQIRATILVTRRMPRVMCEIFLSRHILTFDFFIQSEKSLVRKVLWAVFWLTIKSSLSEREGKWFSIPNLGLWAVLCKQFH